MAIDFTIPVEQEPMLDLGVVTQPQLSQDVAAKRAGKATYGSGTDYDQSYSDIFSGRELEIRQQIASQQKSNRASDLVNFLSTRKDPLDAEEIASKFTSPIEPNSVIEDNYARQYMNYFNTAPGHTIETDDNGTWQEMMSVDPQYGHRLNTLSENLVSFREMLNTGLEDAQATYEGQGWVPYIADTLKSVTQLYPEFKLRGGVTGAEFALGLGTTLKNQRTALLNMPFAQAKQEYRAKLEALMRDNPQMAVEWAKSMKGLSESDEFINNVFTLAAPLDLYAGAKIGVDVARGMTTGLVARTMAKEVVKAAPAADKQTIRVGVADAAGMNPDAGIVRSAQNIMNLEGTDQVKEVVSGFQSALRSDMSVATSRPGNYGAEVMNRISEAYENAIDKITNAIQNVSRVERIGDVLSSEKVMSAAWAEIKDNYRSLSNNILQINPVKYNPLDGGHSVDLILGRADGSFFASPQEADAWAKLNGINISHYNDVPALRGQKRTGAYRRELEVEGPTAEGEVVGKRYYLALNKPLRETDSVVRDALIETGKSKDSNKGWLNSLGAPAWIRTPEEVLDKQQRINRLTAVYAPAILKQVISDLTKEVGLARNSWKSGFNVKEIYKHLSGNSDFSRFMDMSLKKVDPDTGIPGFEYRDIPAVDAAFRQFIGRPAHPVEIEGYFGYQRGLAMDWSFRNLALYRNMRRVGAETHSLYFFDQGRNKISSTPFVGVLHKQMPDRNVQASPVFLMDDNGSRVYMSNGIQNAARGRAAIKGLETGEYKLIELYNRDLMPLKDFMGLGVDNNIKYVLTKNVETRPLEFQQLPRQKGGHLVYDYDHYIKQANITTETGFREKDPFYRYVGDRTVMPIENRLLGKDIAKKLDDVRLALKSGDKALAKQHARDLPIPYDDLVSWFYPKRGPGGEQIAARLSMDHPFYVVPRNKTIKDIPNDFNKFVDTKGIDRLRDGTTSGSLAKQFQVEFTGERDAHEVFTITNEKGTRANPLYNYEPAKTVDPITVLNRSMSKVIDSLWMEDYKMSSMEHWLQEAMSIKDPITGEPGSAFKESVEDIRSAPFYHFMNTPLKAGLDQETKQLLEAKRFMIKSFNGVPSNLQAYLDGVQQTLADKIYGSEGITRKTWQLTKYALTKTTNAPAFLRAAAYRADIGLFSIPQLLVQSMTYVSIFGMAGEDIGYNILKGYGRAAQGTTGALLHQYSRINKNPEILNSLDNIAQKMGFKPGQWLEAREALARTGFEYVGAESNILISHYHMEPRVVQSSWGTFLDAGDMFFKGGERNVRYGAWYTAYQDFRKTKPVGKLTNQDINEILLKADIYAGNMTKASKSALQMGPLSFPSQFLGYQMRLTELFLGKRITNAQRARLFGTYSLMYGLPVSTTAVALGLPLNEQIKKYALDWGYVDGESKISDALMNGVPEAIMRMITGKGYNVAERYGPQPFDLYRDVLSGDKSFMSIFAGAAGGLVTDAFQAVDPFFDWARSFINNDGKHLHVTPDMIAGLLKPIASVNNATRFQTAVSTGVWRSKNETPIKEGVSPLDAAMMTLTGLQPEEASRTRTIKMATEDQKKNEDTAAFKFTQMFHRGLQALTNRDFDNASQYFDEGSALLDLYGYPQQKRDQLLAQALDGRTLPDRTLWAYYLGRDVPSGKEDQRRQTYGRILQLQNKEQ